MNRAAPCGGRKHSVFGAPHRPTSGACLQERRCGTVSAGPVPKCFTCVATEPTNIVIPHACSNPNTPRFTDHTPVKRNRRGRRADAREMRRRLALMRSLRGAAPATRAVFPTDESPMRTIFIALEGAGKRLRRPRPPELGGASVRAHTRARKRDTRRLGLNQSFDRLI